MWKANSGTGPGVFSSLLSMVWIHAGIIYVFIRRDLALTLISPNKDFIHLSRHMKSDLSAPFILLGLTGYARSSTQNMINPKLKDSATDYTDQHGLLN